ncbi:MULTISPECIES: cytochrome c family protein [unclassified Hyphomonas]|jgi:cytochrome c|uniref:Membrane c-type cytochrome cy n=3 Tax=root TaxID=1 RepID=A0A170PTS0_9ZZZZ|nr:MULTISPECIES: cytochrome c family protein [unclassified Hyphomonas]MBG66876.1 cytochrome c family protein [Hyphomonas sp.]MDF1807379.1 cytochrome c family protein [Hyphomonas sp.]QSR21843.1 cytochrome c family protein [Hyphomonas sp. KY3]RCL87990.1 MAG: cytochrome c family protein [Hyphomonas sp.]|tara:strand:- start:1076 stop:1627 length:552 start_codon:yes stop_codon:yes gene_type:complete
MKLTSSLAVAAIVLLTACGGSDAPANDTPAEEAPPAKAPAEAAPAAAPAEAAVDAVSPFAALPAPYNTADYARGRRTWKLCQSCHITAEGGGNLVGPNLHGLFGREAGTLEGFAYSPALQEADFIWTPDKVDHWLENPRTFLPGNRMTFAGVRKPDDRLAVVAYLMSETGFTAEATPEDVPAE